MTSMYWLVLASAALIYMTLLSMMKKLSEIAGLLGQINEHSRVISHHNLPEIVRHLDAINNSVHDPLWKKYDA